MNDANSKTNFITLQQWTGADLVSIANDPSKTNWAEALDRAIVNSTELHSLEFPPRAPLLEPWFCEGDLGLIFAPRGVGKTWFALQIARALSEGSSMGPWKAPAPTKVLFIDGEMPPDLMRDRDWGLRRSAGDIEFH